jgi:flagellar hook assembly protein FlgD
LRRNAPNPFNPVTTIRYELARTGRVDLVVLDVSGREVRRLIDGATIPAGRRTAVWDGRDASGRDAAAGLYFYRLTTEDFSGTGRMMLVK